MQNYTEPLTAAELHELKACFERTEGMISFDEAQLLYRMAKEVRSGCIIEVGSYRGRSAVFLGRGSRDGSKVPVFAVDPHKSFVGVLGGIFGPSDRVAFYRAMLDNGCGEVVSLINLSSEDFAQSWSEPVSLLWIDGDHSYEGVKRDFQSWHPHVRVNALIAFDDATDPQLGPRKLIDELVAAGGFEQVASVGKVAVIRACRVSEGREGYDHS